MSLPAVILISLAGNGAGRTGDQMPNNNIPQILIQPLQPTLITGVAQKLPVLIRVQAPDAVETGEKKARNPYHLALVIDRSGSMSGPPLLEAVRCAKHITDQLAPTDTASLVIFDSNQIKAWACSNSTVES
jgi:Ca-activated chloride channel family protein